MTYFNQFIQSVNKVPNAPLAVEINRVAHIENRYWIASIETFFTI